MNNQQAIDRLVKHLEWGWSEETVAAIEIVKRGGRDER